MPLKDKLAGLQARSIFRADMSELVSRVRGAMFDLQVGFVEDPSRRKANHSGRRSGKTQGAAYGIVETALRHPGCTIPIMQVARTSSASLAMAGNLKRINEDQRLGGEWNETSQRLTLPNASRIQLQGGSTLPDWDKLRGDKYPLVVVDEAGAFRPSVLDAGFDLSAEPATMDMNGQVWLLGTPVAHCRGMFFEVCVGRRTGWSVHHWDARQNPHIPHAAQWLEELIASRKWTWDHPTIQREYLGRWLEDTDAMVYKYQPGVNDVYQLPEGIPWNYSIGLDYGWSDASAWVVLAWHPSHHHIYVVHNHAKSQMTVSEVGRYTKELLQRYPAGRVLCDTGGLGKTITEELRKRWQVPVHTADKLGKYAHIQTMNADLIGGRLKVVMPSNKDVAEEWQILQWDESRMKEDPRFDNHRSDACLYGFTDVHTYLRDRPTPQKERRYTPDQDEYWTELARKARAQAMQIQRKDPYADPFRR